MSRLIHLKTKDVVAESVLKARNLWERTRGLLGRTHFPEKEAFWISHCSSIHTFFMKFPIDVIFVDKELKVTSLAHSVPSFRILLGGWKSKAVFEMKAGELKKHNIQKGDKLYVGY